VTTKYYVNHLRTIGQELENLGIDRFNLECAEDGYLVWVPNAGKLSPGAVPAPRKIDRLQKLWRGAAKLFGTLSMRRRRRCYRYSLADLSRIERSARNQRGQKLQPADGHSLSQLLRTIGGLADKRGERLLGVSWQDRTVSIVVATAEGKRNVEVFRVDNLYDLWVSMYLRRGDRAVEDVPR